MAEAFTQLSFLCRHGVFCLRCFTLLCTILQLLLCTYLLQHASRGSQPLTPASLVSYLIIHVCRLVPCLFGRLILQTLQFEMLYYIPTPIIASLYCLRGCADTSRGSRPPIPASLLIIHVCRLVPRLFGRLILQTLHGDYASVNIILHHLLFPFFDLVLVYNRSPVT